MFYMLYNSLNLPKIKRLLPALIQLDYLSKLRVKLVEM
jgi:hypothetical protein